jgi:hypothetical protein
MKVEEVENCKSSERRGCNKYISKKYCKLANHLFIFLEKKNHLFILFFENLIIINTQYFSYVSK